MCIKNKVHWKLKLCANLPIFILIKMRPIRLIRRYFSCGWAFVAGDKGGWYVNCLHLCLSTLAQWFGRAKSVQIIINGEILLWYVIFAYQRLHKDPKKNLKRPKNLSKAKSKAAMKNLIFYHFFPWFGSFGVNLMGKAINLCLKVHRGHWNAILYWL